MRNRGSSRQCRIHVQLLTTYKRITCFCTSMCFFESHCYCSHIGTNTTKIPIWGRERALKPNVQNIKTCILPKRWLLIRPTPRQIATFYRNYCTEYIYIFIYRIGSIQREKRKETHRHESNQICTVTVLPADPGGASRAPWRQILEPGPHNRTLCHCLYSTEEAYVCYSVIRYWTVSAGYQSNSKLRWRFYTVCFICRDRDNGVLQWSGVLMASILTASSERVVHVVKSVNPSYRRSLVSSTVHVSHFTLISFPRCASRSVFVLRQA